MDSLSLTEKREQFNEYFMIAHKVNVNIKPLDDDFLLPSAQSLEDVMPYAFRIASEMASIEAQALRPIRNLSDHAADLVAYLTHQSKKIDLMMSYVLHQQDEQEHRFSSIKFGGGGLIIDSNKPMDIGLVAELKMFLTEEAAAVFCYGEVIDCQQQDTGYAISFIFNRIREQDQELLVRASLHLQTLQLRERNQSRK